MTKNYCSFVIQPLLLYLFQSPTAHLYTGKDGNIASSKISCTSPGLMPKTSSPAPGVPSQKLPASKPAGDRKSQAQHSACVRPLALWGLRRPRISSDVSHRAAVPSMQVPCPHQEFHMWASNRMQSMEPWPADWGHCHTSTVCYVNIWENVFEI